MLVFVKKGDVTSVANKDTSNVTVLTGQRGLINPHLTLLSTLYQHSSFGTRNQRRKGLQP
jgi:hypothetical protein